MIVPREGAPPTAATLIAFVSGRMAGYNRPKHVVFVDAVPVTAATGKAQKAGLRRRCAHVGASA